MLAVNKTDLVFLKQFSSIIVGLILLTLLLILLAYRMHGALAPETSPLAAARTEARLQGPAAVYAGETGAAAMAAAAETARAAAATQVAYGGSLDGALIFNNLCGACHVSGAGGAPKLEKAQWASRVSQGVDTLIQHATNGYQGQAGLMPARGGNPALNDEQIRATVLWMLDNLK